jgi:hypothetical protein
VKSLSPGSEQSSKFRIQKLSLQDWKRHVLGHHLSDHGKFEVEALSADDDCVHVVLLSHVHPFYEPGILPIVGRNKVRAYRCRLLIVCLRFLRGQRETLPLLLTQGSNFATDTQQFCMFGTQSRQLISWRRVGCQLLSRGRRRYPLCLAGG